ncbi:Uncharacterised protein [Sphingobacterium multivorum]|uniref:hypothetical protein n=1 Tax=Sphingobacterium multivorum TaxID=28454 RepID=UPI000DFB796A|nr:hypothetical protein [Sphingobacterium multivorum]QQT46091.1 hypothetical protein I6J00_05330 [Sphingobacterium multivorum]SUJ31017.1 Uncharacterised protein [Sphingobacterium multivorum]
MNFKTFSTFLLKYWFGEDKDTCIFLGSELQKGSLCVVVETYKLWKEESLGKRVKSLFFRKWDPSQDIMNRIGKEIFFAEIFGLETDFGPQLLALNHEHNSKKWIFQSLGEDDVKKAESLDAMYMLLNNAHRECSSRYLHLHLFERAPNICLLLNPMLAKVPVTSIQYSVVVHNAFVFNAIRSSKMTYADSIISYIYELQNLQIKTALCLHETLYLIDYNEKHKGGAVVLKAEISAIGELESAIGYLKASIEKIIVLLGLLFGVPNLENQKTHKQKLNNLYNAIPDNYKNSFYFELIEELIGSESIQELNNYRNGLMHKKGISKLQPHSFAGMNARDLPLREVFGFIIEQHSKNSAVLLSTYAMLTDKLVADESTAVGL